MSAGKGCFGCLSVLGGVVGIFVAITISFSFYLIPIAFLLFIGSLILISLALGPPASSEANHKRSQPEVKDDSNRKN